MSFTTVSIRFKMKTFQSLLGMIPLQVKWHHKLFEYFLQKISQYAVFISGKRTDQKQKNKRNKHVRYSQHANTKKGSNTLLIETYVNKLKPANKTR